MGSRFSSDRLGMALVLETVRDRGRPDQVICDLTATSVLARLLGEQRQNPRNSRATFGFVLVCRWNG